MSKCEDLMASLSLAARPSLCWWRFYLLCVCIFQVDCRAGDVGVLCGLTAGWAEMDVCPAGRWQEADRSADADSGLQAEGCAPFAWELREQQLSPSFLRWAGRCMGCELTRVTVALGPPPGLPGHSPPTSLPHGQRCAGSSPVRV